MLDECLPTICVDAASDGFALDMVVCDANISPAQSMGIAASVMESGILARDATLIITLKNFCKSDSQWEMECAAARDIFCAAVAVDCSGGAGGAGGKACEGRTRSANDTLAKGGARLIHLFSNGSAECTLVAKVNGTRCHELARALKERSEEFNREANKRLEGMRARDPEHWTIQKKKREFEERVRKRDQAREE